MAILVDSKTDKSDKNYWGTTLECFADAQLVYGRKFSWDVCAERSTSKCGLSYWNLDEEGNDALELDWPDDWWCNPPFDRKMDFITKAKSESTLGRRGMMLLPYEPLTKWWQSSLSTGCVIYEPDGRYNFLERDGITKKNGVNFGVALVAFPSIVIGESVRVRFTRGAVAR